MQRQRTETCGVVWCVVKEGCQTGCSGKRVLDKDQDMDRHGPMAAGAALQGGVQRAVQACKLPGVSRLRKASSKAAGEFGDALFNLAPGRT